MSTATDTWTPCSERLPHNGEAVLTKVHDARGERNEQKLVRRGNLWFTADGSMYVYFTPTHWKRETR